MRISIDPDDDVRGQVLDGFVQRRRSALDSLLTAMRKRVGASIGQVVDSDLATFQSLPDPIQRRLVLGPLYNAWWCAASKAFADGDRAHLEEVLPRLGRLLVVPAQAAAVPLRERVEVPVGHDGLVHLPPHGGFGPPAPPAAVVHVGLRDGELIVDGPWGRRPAVLVSPPQRIPGTAIDLDASDPSVAAFLVDEVNGMEAATGIYPPDVRPAASTPGDAARLASSLQTLTAFWPDFGRELDDVLHLVVPFSSRHKAAFTNTAWHGAVFLRNDFDDQVFNIERLVHETSHVTLSLVMELVALHEHGPRDTVPSPFKAGGRPVNGLYQGAFVFVRIAEALHRGWEATGRERYRHGIGTTLRKVEDAAVILRERVRLTAPGLALLEDIERCAERLRDAHPAAPADADGADREYMDAVVDAEVRS